MYEIPFHKNTIENKQFLITGGAGFIGSNITEYLLQHGAKVRVFDNLATGNIENLSAFMVMNQICRKKKNALAIHCRHMQ